ncbi:hypothetical protein OTU49_007422, partial [Cherax quadricarinatus]
SILQMSSSNKFDDLLTRLGTGRWNLMYFLSAGYWYLLLPGQTFSVIFMAPALNYTCRPPEGNHTVHVSEDSCYYSINKSSLVGVEEEEPCTEWDFDTSVFSTTLTSEFGLVCGKAYLRATFQSVYMFSTIFSSLISGYIADKYGRKVVVVVSMGLFSLISLVLTFVTNYQVILALRFFMGALSSATLYMLSMEVCEVKQRSVVGVVLGLPWAIGTMCWGALAYGIRDWRWLQAISSFPFLIIIPVLFQINESPRWLIVRGRHQQALHVLHRAARLNKATLPPEDQLCKMMNDIQAEAEMANTKSTRKGKQVLDEHRRWFTFPTPALFSTAKIRQITIVMSLNIFSCSLVYCGLSLSGNAYSSDPFLYVVIGGLMEVPGYTLSAPIISRWGRKKPIIIGWFVSGASILSLVFIPKDISWLVMVLAMIGKLAISGVFMVVFVYEAELLPTEVRLQGVAVIFVAGQIAATCSPYLADFLSPLVPWLPSVIFGVSSFVAGFSLFNLPETRGMALPDTISDLEELYKQNKFSETKKEEELEKLQT